MRKPCAYCGGYMAHTTSTCNSEPARARRKLLRSRRRAVAKELLATGYVRDGRGWVRAEELEAK
jgi:hypothetical protein